ncbi:MAG: single-stranded DNA-binding protein [Rhodospirillaceae bacterium]|nr:single-stranded DNA-binding protein [Rhodospirillaceae bacterium]MDE0379676.1 single-stranded DNA-binding protein [Rhodospirillales bacterium]
MLHVNRATLLGRAGRDPDVRTLKGGGKAAAFSLATNQKWTDREGRPTEATEWHRVVVYGPAAAAVEKMLRKGDAVLVEGRVATRGFTDKDGTERTITEIVVAGPQGTVSILPGRRAADAPQDSGNPGPAEAEAARQAEAPDNGADPGTG